MEAESSYRAPRCYEKVTDFAEHFNKNIRPLLDAVDKLRNLEVTSEEIPLPTIVVVGDQSSGKTSVLESLSGVSLPRGQGIVSRVPLVLRLQSCPAAESSIYISYRDLEKDSVLEICEEDIMEAVDYATDALAGVSKGVSHEAVSLHIRKPDAPDLTMIDLPGIPVVTVEGQQNDTYEQIVAMIRHYVTPPETVILNVLSATVDFFACESVHICREIDELGERTLAVVTKVDKAPENVYKKVTTNVMGTSWGYVCVRNRIDDAETLEEARRLEKMWFQSHGFLSLLDKRFVGVNVLAERLTMIQAKMIRLRLLAIEIKIDQAVGERQKELELLVKDLPSRDGEPIEWFMKTLHRNTTTMENLLVNGNHDGFVDQQHMHYSARLEEILQKFSDKLHENLKLLLLPSKTEEVLKRITESRGFSLPNVLPHTLLKTLVREEIGKVSDLCIGVVTDAHSYATRFALDVVEESTSAFQILLAMYKQILQEVVKASLVTCMDFVHRILAKEKSTVFTVNKFYKQTITTIRQHLAKLHNPWESSFQYNPFASSVSISGDKDFTVDFRELSDKLSSDYESAFDLKMNLLAYLSLVYTRMADGISVEVRYSLEGALLRNLSKGVLDASRGQPIAHTMQEYPWNVQNRENLRKRVEVLKDCKELMRNALQK